MEQQSLENFKMVFLAGKRASLPRKLLRQDGRLSRGRSGHADHAQIAGAAEIPAQPGTATATTDGRRDDGVAFG